MLGDCVNSRISLDCGEKCGVKRCKTWTGGLFDYAFRWHR